jgi:hypothetical protein
MIKPNGSIENFPKNSKVEIRIPISANDAFFRMTRIFLESLQLFGGPLGRSAHCVASISRDTPMRDLARECPWSSDYSLDFRWVDENLFENHGYHGTGFDRKTVQSEADIVVLCDADIMIAGDFDELITMAHNNHSLNGWLGHWSPFVVDRKTAKISSQKWWDRIFEEAGLPAQALQFQCPGYGFGYHDSNHSHCPYYYNAGFLVAPQEIFRLVSKTFLDDVSCVERVLDSVHKSQIAMTLSQVRHDIKCELSGLKYNCPVGISEKRLRNSTPRCNDADDVRVFHYLADVEINKSHFRSEKALRQLMARKNLSPTGTVMQKKLSQILESLAEKDARRSQEDS